MTIVEEAPISRRDLRNFGLTFAAMFGVLFGTVLPLIRHRPAAVWPWIVAAASFALALVSPASLRPLHKAMTVFGHLLGAIQTKIFLAIVFFVVIIPTGAVRRLIGRRRRFEPKLTTYRLPSHLRQPKTMERPF